MPVSPSNSTSGPDSGGRAHLILKKIVLHNDLITEDTFEKYRELQKKARKYEVHLSLSDILYHRNILSESQFEQVQDHVSEQFEDNFNFLPLCMQYEDLARDDLPEQLTSRGVCTESQVQATNRLQTRIKQLGISVPWGIIFVNNENVSPEFVDQALQLDKLDRSEEDQATFSEEEAVETTFGQLALENDVVTEDQLDEAIQVQEELFEEDEFHIPLGEVFVEKGFASQEVVDSLLEIQNQLRSGHEGVYKRESVSPPEEQNENTLGELALQNGLITEEEHQRALEIQANIQQRGISKRIGEVLIEKGFIEEEVIDSLLQVQETRRGLGPKSEFLPDGKDLRSDQSIQKIETVLGKLAVSNDVITEDQLEKALQIQSNLEEDAYIPLGEILVKRGFATKKAIKALLRMQEILREEHTDLIVSQIDRPTLKGEAGSVLGELAVRNGIITEKQLQEAVRFREKVEAEGMDKPMGEILMDEGYIDEQTLDSLLELQEAKRRLDEQRDEEPSEQLQEEEFPTVDETESTGDEAIKSPASFLEDEEEKHTEGIWEKLDALSEFDHTLLNALKSRGKIAESQIPLIINKQWELKREQSGENALYNALTELGIVSKDELSELLSSTLDQSQQEKAKEEQSVYAASMIGFLVLSGILVGGGVYWFLLQPSPKPSQPATIGGTEPRRNGQDENIRYSQAEQADDPDTESENAQPKFQPRDEIQEVSNQVSVQKQKEGRMSFQIQSTLPEFFSPETRLRLRVFYEDIPLPGSRTEIALNQHHAFRTKIGPFHRGSGENQLPPGIYVSLIHPSVPPVQLPESIRFALESRSNRTRWFLTSNPTRTLWNFVLLTSQGSFEDIIRFHEEWLQFTRKSYEKIQTPFNLWKKKLLNGIGNKQNTTNQALLKKLIEKVEKNSKRYQKRLEKLEQQFLILPYETTRTKLRDLFSVLPGRMKTITEQYYSKSDQQTPKWLSGGRNDSNSSRSLKDSMNTLTEQLEGILDHIPTQKPKRLLQERIQNRYRFTGWKMLQFQTLLSLLENSSFREEVFRGYDRGRTYALKTFYQFGLAYLRTQTQTLKNNPFIEKAPLTQYKEMAKIMERQLRSRLKNFAESKGHVPNYLTGDTEDPEVLKKQLEGLLQKLNLNPEMEAPECNLCPEHPE